MLGAAQQLVQQRNDLTRAQASLEEQARELEQASRYKSEFLANMSHELRTPLNAIIGFSEIMENGLFGPLGDKYTDYVKDIRSSGGYLLGIIDDILDMSRIECFMPPVPWLIVGWSIAAASPAGLQCPIAACSGGQAASLPLEGMAE